MLIDIWHALQAQLRDRLFSPLFGAFAISWALWNYKFLMALFAETSVTHTMYLIDTIAFPEPHSVILYGFFYPLSTALFYLLLLPYPARFIFEFTRRRQRELRHIRHRVEEETLLTAEESRALKQEMVHLRTAHAEESAQKDSEIEGLKTEMKVLRKKYGAKRENSLSDSQLQILFLIDERDGAVQAQQLIEEMELPKVRVHYDLGELVNQKMLEVSPGPIEELNQYRLTHSGRREVVRFIDLAQK